MATNSVPNEILNTNPVSLVTSKWSHPIEGFTPHPKYATPLQYDLTKNIDNTIKESKKELNKSEVILAHETTEESAIEIINSGFKLEEKGSCPIRNKAIFGWIHKKDIGYFSKTEHSSANYTVLFSVPRNQLFVSSYSTSATQLLLGEITEQEYESKHVLEYSDYESIHWTCPTKVNHLNYTAESLLPSK